jgi:mannose-6-phosphate isomerase-like protein (cupin superfamily)
LPNYPSFLKNINSKLEVTLDQTKMEQAVIITDEPREITLEDNGIVFGKVVEITSRAFGADRANVALVTLEGSDLIHHHQNGQETYICVTGEGELLLGAATETIIPFREGVRVIVRPGTKHAARPLAGQTLEFICVSSPAFDPADVYNDPRGRNW